MVVIAMDENKERKVLETVVGEGVTLDKMAWVFISIM